MKSRIILGKTLGIIVLALILIAQPVYSHDSAISLFIELLGFIFLAIASFGRTWASAFISGKKDKHLTTDGPYSICRNPLYFFSFVGFIGVGFVFKSLIILLVFLVIFSITHIHTILNEEKKLQVIFSPEYDDYKRAVPRFFPNFKLFKTADSVCFSPRIYTKALFESALILSAYPILKIIEWLHMHSILPVVFNIY